MNEDMRVSLFALSVVFLAPILSAQRPGAPPAPYAVPNPAYVTIPLEIKVDRPAAEVWKRVGKYCDIGEWLQIPCTIVSGDGGVGTVRSVGGEVLMGETQLSYIYTQRVRTDQPYNLYHGTIEARPLTPTTSKLLYTLVYDNSMLADDTAREKDTAQRTAMFTRALQNMKTLAEGGTLPAPPARGDGPGRGPAPYAIPNPAYVTIPLEITVNRPAAEVWKRVGKFCDIGEWLQVPCTIVSGNGEVGSLRTVGGAVNVGQTELSLTYAQRERTDQPYNLWHGTIEARPVTATTSKLVYTLLYDNSILADDAAREKEKAQRTAMFTRALQNMKTLAEGGTLPPPPARGDGR